MKDIDPNKVTMNQENNELSSETESNESLEQTRIEKMPNSDIYILPIQYSPVEYIFQLTVRQDPVKARTIGFADKDRRPMDPPPVVQLTISDKQGRKFIDPHRRYITHASLWSQGSEKMLVVNRSVTPDEQRNQSPSQYILPTLVGSTTALGEVRRDDKDEDVMFFVFSDLSIRTTGQFSLKFNLFRLEDVESINAGAPCLSSAFSNVFTAYNQKDFPGLSESTHLTKILYKQGVKVNVRENRT